MDPQVVRSEVRSMMKRAREEGWDDRRILRDLQALGERAQFQNPRGWAHIQLGFRQKWRRQKVAL
jgi:hypothetical protein